MWYICCKPIYIYIFIKYIYCKPGANLCELHNLSPSRCLPPEFPFLYYPSHNMVISCILDLFMFYQKYLNFLALFNTIWFYLIFYFIQNIWIFKPILSFSLVSILRWSRAESAEKTLMSNCEDSHIYLFFSK